MANLPFISSSTVVWFFLFTYASVSGQQTRELTSFDEILDFTEVGVGRLSLVVHLPHCISDWDLGYLHSVIQFDSWLSYDHGNGTLRFRTAKNFLNDEGEWVFWIAQSFNDNVTEVYSRHYNKDFELNSEKIFYCPIGDGARFFLGGDERPIEDLSSYDNLKAALLDGKHVNIKALVSECEGYSLAYEAITNSKWVDTWEVTNQGLDNETIWITWDVWIDHHLDTAPVGIENILAAIRPDGTVQYVPMIFDMLSWNEGFQLGDGFVCQLGETFLAASHVESSSDAKVVEYVSFQELLHGLENDHEIEVLVDAKNCEWDSPNNYFYPAVFGQNLPVWTVHRSEERTFVSFFDYSSGMNDGGRGILIHEQYAVEDDDTAKIAFHRLDPVEKTVIASDEAVCPMGTGVTFRSRVRERHVLETFQNLTTALLEGRRVSWYVDLSTCSGFLGNVTVEAGGAFPATAAFDPMSNNGTFYGPITQLANPDDNGEKFAWVDMAVNWFGETEFVLTFNEYDFETFDDNLDGQGAAYCQVGYPNAYIYY